MWEFETVCKADYKLHENSLSETLSDDGFSIQTIISVMIRDKSQFLLFAAPLFGLTLVFGMMFN